MNTLACSGCPIRVKDIKYQSNNKLSYHSKYHIGSLNKDWNQTLWKNV